MRKNYSRIVNLVSFLAIRALLKSYQLRMKSTKVLIVRRLKKFETKV